MWYREGTISVTNGSTTVTGSGTYWAASIMPGDSLLVNGKQHEIASVQSDTQLTLVDAFAEASVVDSEYAIIVISTTTTGLATRITNVATLWQQRENEIAAWQAGTIDGGPNGDGKYPLTAPDGVVQYVLCPVAISSLSSGASDWANYPEDVEIPGFPGRYSSMHWSNKSEDYAILAAESEALMAPHYSDIGTIATNIANVNSVAANAININTVAADSADIDSVATNIANVNTVASMASDIDAVLLDQANIDSVATNIANVNSVAANASNINTVANDSVDINTIISMASDIDAVLADKNNIDSVATNISNVNSVATNIANVNSVASNATNINAVAANSVNINTTAGMSADIDAVLADKNNIGSVATNISNVNSVAANAININAVASNASNINTVAADLTNIDAVATNISNINSVVANAANINTVANDSADINTIIGMSSDIDTVVLNMTAIQNAPTQAALAEDWATEAEDVLVSGIGYSAYHWAKKAAASVTNGVIDDSAVSTTFTWSSSKISSELLGIDAATVNGKTVETSVPVGAVFTDTVYDDTDVVKAPSGVLPALDGSNLTNVSTVASINDLTDVDTATTAPNVGKVLVWNGSKWVPGVVTDVVTLSTAQTVSNKTLELSSYTQIADASLGTGTHVFDYSAGDMQQLTATGDITIAFSNFVTGKVCTMIIDAVNWGDYIITHPAAMLFAAGTAPTYTAGGTDRLMVVKDKDDIYSLFIVGQAVAVVA